MIVPLSFMPSDDVAAQLASPLENERHFRVESGWEQPPPLLVKAIEDPGPQARALIGEHGAERLQQFLRVEKGWDFGRGSRLSRRSVALLKIFAERYEALVSRLAEPSIYLDPGGYLRLEWDLSNGGELSIDFPADGESILVYLEKADADITEQQHHILHESVTHILTQAES